MDKPGGAEIIRTVEELMEYIEEVGFLPLFQNEIPGFSVEEHTDPHCWWCHDPEKDPWKWREIIARSGRMAYGKFFDKKAGFLSLDWLPYFANYRRDGYDFDALWDDGKASYRQKRIMDAEEAHPDVLSNELKALSGFGKGGEKNFDGILTGLQMQTYLCIRDFRKRINRQGEPYGWSIAVYARPEELWGYDAVTRAYGESPEESKRRIYEHMEKRYAVGGKAIKGL